MKVIGVTGGVGAGKSTVLGMLNKMCNCECIMADDVAKSLMQRNGILAEDAIRLFGPEAYTATGELDRSYLAGRIYEDSELRKQWNACVHPATNARIRELVENARADGRDYAFVEAALLIENHYEEFCDELWYVYASPEVRAGRLLSDRGYSGERTRAMDAAMLSDEAFRSHCDRVIDTGISLEETRRQLEKALVEAG